VLIETDDQAPGPALPVLGYNFIAQPMTIPTISAVAASPDATQPILAGGSIAITGLNLAAGPGGNTQVTIHGTVVPPTGTPAATGITLALPAGLAAGGQTVQVSQPLNLGSPPVLHPGTGPTSPPFAFTLLPEVSSAVAAAGPGVTVTLNPQVQIGQRVILAMTAQAAPNAMTLFDGGTQTAAISSLTIPTPGLASGSYGVQVLVDGAESPAGPTVAL
jgi:hypothetical protein